MNYTKDFYNIFNVILVFVYLFVISFPLIKILLLIVIMLTRLILYFFEGLYIRNMTFFIRFAIRLPMRIYEINFHNNTYKKTVLILSIFYVLFLFSSVFYTIFGILTDNHYLLSYSLPIKIINCIKDYSFAFYKAYFVVYLLMDKVIIYHKIIISLLFTIFILLVIFVSALISYDSKREEQSNIVFRIYALIIDLVYFFLYLKLLVCLRNYNTNTSNWKEFIENKERTIIKNSSNETSILIFKLEQTTFNEYMEISKEIIPRINLYSYNDTIDVDQYYNTKSKFYFYRLLTVSSIFMVIVNILFTALNFISLFCSFDLFTTINDVVFAIVMILYLILNSLNLWFLFIKSDVRKKYLTN